jgi:hypothetical protein
MRFHGVLKYVILFICAHTKSMAVPMQSYTKLTNFEQRYVTTINQLIFLVISHADIFPNRVEVFVLFTPLSKL